MKKIKEIIDIIFDKISDVLTKLFPVFFFGFFIFGIYHVITKEKSIDIFIKENAFITLFSIFLAILIVFVLLKIKRNKNNVFYPRLIIAHIFFPLIILMTLITLWQCILYPALFLIPIIFLILLLNYITEYYKISGNILYVKRGILNKIIKVNINEIFSIGYREDHLGDGVTKMLLIHLVNNQIIELQGEMDNKVNFIKRLQYINKNIFINVYDKILIKKENIETGNNIYEELMVEKKHSVFNNIIETLFLIVIYIIIIYIIIKMIMYRTIDFNKIL